MLDTLNRRLVLPLLAAKRGSTYLRDLVALERTQFESPEQIRARQLTLLKTQLQHAFATVPYYQRTWAAAGIHPSDLNSLADLAHFPILPKADIRTRGPELYSTAYRNALALPRPGIRIGASSPRATSSAKVRGHIPRAVQASSPLSNKRSLGAGFVRKVSCIQIALRFRGAIGQSSFDRFQVEYNDIRPHSTIDYRTPSEYRAELLNQAPGSARARQAGPSLRLELALVPTSNQNQN